MAGLKLTEAVEKRKQSEFESCRVIVFGHGRDEILLDVTESGFVLPSLQIPRWERPAENLTTALKSKWGCDAVCLFNLNRVYLPEDCSVDTDQYQIMESWRDQRLTDGATWKPVCSLTANSFRSEKDVWILEQCLVQLKAYGSDNQSPFARRGWLSDLRSWIADVIPSFGLELRDLLRQYNSGPAFSLVRFETNGPGVWFKAVGKPNLHEFPITLRLAELFPRFMPKILATRPEWNGWLSREVKGTNLGDTTDIALWQKAAADLASLQIESISTTNCILETGAHDLGFDALTASIVPFFDVTACLMREQTKVPPNPLSVHDLGLLKLRIQDALTLLHELRIANTLGHLDLNPWNVIVGEDRCVFLDWAEAYVGHPFFSFEYLLQHFRREINTSDSLRSKLVDAYKAPWRELFPEYLITDALRLVRLVAVFAYAAGTKIWRDKDRLKDPKVAGYVRGLARRMNREAIEFTERRTVCPS